MKSARIAAVRPFSLAAALAVALAPLQLFAGGGDAVSSATRVAALGERLFRDQRLSADGKVSCATCHAPNRAFTDGLPVSVGLGERKGTRNSPTLLNVTEHDSFFWDGRRATLEEQVLDPFLSAAEHGLESTSHLVNLVAADASYRNEFDRLYPSEGVDRTAIAKAIATYIRSLAPGPSRFDRAAHGDPSALTRSEARGLELFKGPADCASCHSISGNRASFTDNEFHSLAVGMEKLGARLAETALRASNAMPAERDKLITSDSAVAALGRFNVTGAPRTTSCATA
jgi:cytochrome c peroxidase